MKHEQSQSILKSILDQIMPKSSANSTDFEDIDEQTLTSPVDIRQIGVTIQKHLENPQSLIPEDDRKLALAASFDAKRIQHNQSLIQQKREQSIMVL